LNLPDRHESCRAGCSLGFIALLPSVWILAGDALKGTGSKISGGLLFSNSSPFVPLDSTLNYLGWVNWRLGLCSNLLELIINTNWVYGELMELLAFTYNYIGDLVK
jgi:hypothetical protein